jgi:hypothetical protein
MPTLNYQDIYSRMGDDELLRLTSQWATLTETAQSALAAELNGGARTTVIGERSD